jgi:hypothetical protein
MGLIVDNGDLWQIHTHRFERRGRYWEWMSCDDDSSGERDACMHLVDPAPPKVYPD